MNATTESRIVHRDNQEGIRLAAESWQLRQMLTLGTLLFLVPATIARLSGWRWRPWPPGPQGYRSILGEARDASHTYVPYGFVSW